MSAQFNHALDKLFNPHSVAIVGASRDSKKIGYIVLKNIMDSGFEGVIYPVNPNANDILGHKCYSSVENLPETPDLTIISLPSTLVIEVVENLAKIGAKNAVIFSSGFKEIGEEGKSLEKKLTECAMRNHINLLGPNCLGFVNNRAKLNSTFANVKNTTGNLRFISQSGALAASIFDWIKNQDLGFEEFITLGNKAVLNENHILDYWQSQKNEYKPVLMYLESISNGKKFLELSSMFIHHSPLIILKPGKSLEAKNAMLSHTGSLAGEEAVLDTALKDAGIIRCYGVEEFFDYAKAFSWSRPPEGPNVAIVSNAGGPAVITVDLLSDYNLKLAPLDFNLQEKLHQHLPREASVFNPVDILGDALADRYKSSLDVLLPQKSVHAVLVILTPQVMTEIEKTAQIIGEMSKKYKKPILCSFIGGSAYTTGQEVLNKFQVPAFEFPERAVRALGAMHRWREWVKKPVLQIFTSQIHIASETLPVISDLKELDNLVSGLGIRTPPSELINTFEQARDFAAEYKYPVVLKLASTQIMHKTENKAVITNIDSAEKLQNAVYELQKNSNELFIQKQIENGLELIVGLKQDYSFGQTLMFGAGGTMVELLKDTNLKTLPITKEEIRELVQKSKIYPLLKGYRNSPPYYLEGLYDLIEKVAAFPKVEQFEINPVIITHKDIWAVDLKLIV